MMLGEFLNWDSPGPYQWQLIDGVPVAMSPPAVRHALVENELGSLIRNHFLERGSACRVFTNAGVVPGVQSDRNYMIPDLAVTCSDSDLSGQFLRA
jgi:Uma2 family endonuclease